MLGLGGLLAACGQEADTNETVTANAPTEATGNMMTGNMAGDMANRSIPREGTARAAKGSGTVTAIDRTAGTITVNHGPIPEANWPAMTMAFKAKPGVIERVQVGDKIAFDLALNDGSSEVTAITNQQ